MKVEVKVPSVGESVQEATIASLLKQSGSQVKQDEEIIEIETDKVNQIIYSPAAGKLELTVKVDDVVKIGQTIGSIDTENVTEAPASQKEAPKPEESTKPAVESTPSSSDAARKTEEEFVQNLEKKPPPPEPSAPAPAAPAPAAPPEKEERGERRERMSKLRRLVATRLVEVKNQTAMLTTFNEVDLSQVIQIRKKEQESFQKKHGVKLGFMSFFVKACVSALQEFPAINARIDKDEIVYRDYFDVGIAVGTDKGLMVPVLRDCQKMSCAEVEKKLKDFAEKARKGMISVDDLQGGTFTITNGGVYGSLLSTPILNPPQSGILGMHAIVERPMNVGGKVEIRPMMYVALSYDHRIVDGKEAIGFLVHIKKNLEDPSRFILE